MYRIWGTVTKVLGIRIEVKGINNHIVLGSICEIHLSDRSFFLEVIGIDEEFATMSPYGSTNGISTGDKVYVYNSKPYIYPDISWRGNIINGMGESVSSSIKTNIKNGPARNIYSDPIKSYDRKRMGPRIDLGIKAMNTFLPCCRGQRMGIFAASGVGKSVLMSMLAKYSQCEINVIGLIGERGREVNEFIEDHLGEEGLAKSIVVVATSDESALMRRRAAYVTLTVAEFFRDQGFHVLCMIDSLTRFAMSQREIGLASGEPPAMKGYSPSIFSMLPSLLERAGPGLNGSDGDITALMTVLVEGDDHDEPIADTVRGIMDGHIVLDRSIGEKGRYPSINILRSISRSLPSCHSDKENEILRNAKKIISTYSDMEDMIRMGAYKHGSDISVDNAIILSAKIESFLSQKKSEKFNIETSFRLLESSLL
jgi:flagellum-specific ATP synthase